MAFDGTKKSIDLVINGRDRSKSAINGVDKNISRIERSAKRAGAAIIAAIGSRAVIRGIGGLIKQASDAEESASKFAHTFGQAAKQTRSQLEQFAEQAGRSRVDLIQMAGDIGALVKPMGLTEDAAGDLSVKVAKLATDLASFHNTTDQEALNALRSGLVGESEPLRRYGVQLSAARIKTVAFSLGLAKQGEELTSAAKAQAIMNIVMQDSAGAQGDAIRTSDGLANSVRRLQGQWKDFSVTLATDFVPAATRAVSALSKLHEDVTAFGADSGAKNFRERFGLEIIQRTAGLFGANRSPAIDQLLKNQFRDEERRLNRAARARRREQLDRQRQEAAFVGPQLPDGGLEAFRESARAANAGGAGGSGGSGGLTLTLPSVKDVTLPNIDGPTRPSDNPDLVQGRLLTGLAQITKQSNSERQLVSKVDEGNRTNREVRDLIREIRESLTGGQPVIVGAFS